MSEFTAEFLAEDTLLLRFGDAIDATINARVHAAAARLRAASLPDISEVAPAYASLMIRFEPLTWGRNDEAPHAQLLSAIEEILRDAASNPAAATASRLIEIPVCYGGECGPDLEDVARHSGLDVRQVIERHTASEYTVAMLGFAPGFPYLLGLDRALHAPRHATPRTRVPAGSVAIGGAQAGIYPRDLPGGWQLIGRTPMVLFDAQHDPPALLAPGDRVRFHAIAQETFASLVADTFRN